MNNPYKKKVGLDFSSSEIRNANSKKNIVIIDEDLSSRIFLKIKFEEAHYTVKEFRSGLEGWNYIESKRINLVIMEMKLPELHGSELLKKIKKMNPKLPVIIYTNHPEFSQDMTVVTFPNHEYLVKPTPAEKILEIATILIEKSNF